VSLSPCKGLREGQCTCVCTCIIVVPRSAMDAGLLNLRYEMHYLSIFYSFGCVAIIR
jgi:hypothetical protein